MGIAVHQKSDSLGDYPTGSSFGEPCVLHLYDWRDGNTLVASDSIVCDYRDFHLLDDAAMDGAADRLEVLLATWRICFSGPGHTARTGALEDLELAQYALRGPNEPRTTRYEKPKCFPNARFPIATEHQLRIWNTHGGQ